MGYKGFDEKIGINFERAPTYTIIDSKTDIISIIENTSEHMDGIGLSSEILKLYGIDILICSGLKGRDLELFNQYNIKVFFGALGTVRNTYDLWKNNKLQEINLENAEYEVTEFKSHRHKIPVDY